MGLFSSSNKKTTNNLSENHQTTSQNSGSSNIGTGNRSTQNNFAVDFGAVGAGIQAADNGAMRTIDAAKEYVASSERANYNALKVNRDVSAGALGFAENLNGRSLTLAGDMNSRSLGLAESFNSRSLNFAGDALGAIQKTQSESMAFRERAGKDAFTFASSLARPDLGAQSNSNNLVFAALAAVAVVAVFKK